MQVVKQGTPLLAPNPAQKEGKQPAPYDPSRTLRMFGFGLCIYGPYQVGPDGRVTGGVWGWLAVYMGAQLQVVPRSLRMQRGADTPPDTFQPTKSCSPPSYSTALTPLPDLSSTGEWGQLVGGRRFAFCHVRRGLMHCGSSGRARHTGPASCRLLSCTALGCTACCAGTTYWTTSCQPGTQSTSLSRCASVQSRAAVAVMPAACACVYISAALQARMWQWLLQWKGTHSAALVAREGVATANE